jgi:CMP-N,N'-diacetyllegionaminic acid synthase
MLNDKRFLAVIPARGGSQGVKRKNIRPLGGRPLLVWTIDQAKQVTAIDLVVVSTDDPEIKQVAEAAGVRVVDRPAELATATASTESALLHALDALTMAGEAAFDYVGVLEPTSPFRRPQSILACMQRIVERDGVSLMTVRETRNVYGRLQDGYFRPLIPGQPRRRQDRETIYVESSTIYFARVDWLRRTGSLVADDWLAVIVDEREGFDINTLEDFRIAEAFLDQRS